MAKGQSEATASLGRTASELARRWASQRLSAVQRYGRILADYSNGSANGRDAALAYARLAMDEAVRYPADAFQIATDYAAAIGRAAGLSFTGTQASKAERAPVLDIELAGTIGRIAKRTFVLENPHDSPATISFTAGNFFDGEQELEVGPSFAPADMVIPAGGEQTITLSVKLDRKQFRAGHAYDASVAVQGFEDMILRVHLTIAGST
ncbi:MAG: hypothetical protein QM688_04185 [Sphingomonas bacterium]